MQTVVLQGLGKEHGGCLLNLLFSSPRIHSTVYSQGRVNQEARRQTMSLLVTKIYMKLPSYVCEVNFLTQKVALLVKPWRPLQNYYKLHTITDLPYNIPLFCPPRIYSGQNVNT